MLETNAGRALIALRAKAAHGLEGETLGGAIWRAGLPKTMLNAAAW